MNIGDHRDRPLTDLAYVRALESELTAAADRRGDRGPSRMPALRRALAYAAIALLVLVVPLALYRILAVTSPVEIGPIEPGPAPVDRPPPNRTDDEPPADVADFTMWISVPDAVDGTCTYTPELMAEDLAPTTYQVELVVTRKEADAEETVVVESWTIGSEEETWSATAEPVTHPQDDAHHSFAMTVRVAESVVHEETLDTDSCPG